MQNHALHIDRIQTCVQGAGAGAAHWAQLMDRSMRTDVPTALGQVIDRYFAAQTGVLRIKHVSLRLNFGQWSGARALSEVFAARFEAALAVCDPIKSSHLPPDVRWWPSHAHYAVDYATAVLDGPPPTDWEYPDFQALTAHLPPQDAAQNALVAAGARAVVLWLLRDANAHSAKDAKLTPDRFWSLCDTVVPAAASCPASDRLDNVLARLDITQTKPPFEVMAAALAQVFPPRELTGQSQLTQKQAQDGLELALAATAVIVCGQCGPLTPLTRAQQHGQDAPQVPPVVTRLWQQIQASPSMLRSIAAHVDRAQQAPTGGAEPDRMSDQSNNSDTCDEKIIVIASDHAGVALILPLIAGHLPARARHPANLSRIATHLLVGSDLDPALVTQLFPPPDPSCSDAPVMPDPPKISSDALAGDKMRRGAAGWADLLLARFATSLSGLHTSSRLYLDTQFLRQSGTVTITPDAINVRLAPIALGIVLRMGGLTGERGPVADLGDRLLTLTVDESI